MNEWTKKRTNQLINQLTNQSANERTDEQTERTNERANKPTQNFRASLSIVGFTFSTMREVNCRCCCRFCCCFHYNFPVTNESPTSSKKLHEESAEEKKYHDSSQNTYKRSFNPSSPSFLCYMMLDGCSLVEVNVTSLFIRRSDTIVCSHHVTSYVFLLHPVK